MNKKDIKKMTTDEKLEMLINLLITKTNSTSTTEDSTEAKTEAKETKKESKLDKYQPKKDEDGYYSFKSYKAQRNRYLKDSGHSYEECGWMTRDEYLEAVKPFEEKFGKYVRKADRK